MEWFDDLYIGESVKNVRKIRWKLKHNAGMIGVYVISIASEESNQLDIIPSWNLMQKAYPKRGLCVVGLAKGRREAFALVQRIVEETYRETGEADVRGYLEKKRRSAS